jgi:hypothetical protein
MFGAWSRRPLPLAVNPLAAGGDTLAGTKNGTHQATIGVAVVLLQPITVTFRPYAQINSP